MNKAIYDIPTKDFKARLDEMVARLDVEKHIHRPTRQLSLGERMKCEFIMAMLHGPRIVFLDEPTIGLDVIAKETIREFIQDMNNNGVTFILTTHDLEDIEHLAKRVMVVNHGEIVFDDSLTELKKYTGDRKILKLTAHTPIGDIDLPGYNHRRVSAYNKELVLDCKVTSLNAFMDFLGKTVHKGYLIEEPPIDDVIKALYLKENDASIKA
jgi:ABC-2 type transport system ATP-binding protein